MGILNKMVFKMLCIVLLVFTTISPSLALAASQPDVHTININAGSKDRKINNLYGTLIPKAIPNNSLRPIEMESSVGENSSRLSVEKAVIELDTEYKVIIGIEYSENGENYLYFDERIVLGGAVLAWDSITIPADEDLKETTIDTSGTGLLKGPVSISNADDKTWMVNNRQIRFLNGKIVSEMPLELQFMYKSQNEKNELHLLYGTFNVGDSLDFNEVMNNTSTLNITGPYNNLVFSPSYSRSGFGINGEEKVHISNGSYNVYLENSNGSKWNGSIDIFENQDFIVPIDPTEMEIEDFWITPQSTNLSTLYYRLKISSGSFQSVNPSMEIHYEILFQGNEKITEWKSNSNFYEVDTTSWKTGSYTLRASYPTSTGESIIAEKKFDHTSDVQELKGTVITADAATGGPMMYGTVTVYKVNKQDEFISLSVETREPIKNVNGTYEAFIPDTFILDGSQYIITITDETTKTAYAKKFVGQSTKNLHFEKESLKQIVLNSNDLSTKEMFIRFVDPLNRHNYLPLSLNPDWKIGTDFFLQAYWKGVDEENTVYYSWSDIIDPDNPVVDILSSDWKTLKPSAKYANAFIALENNVGGQYFKEIKVSHYETDEISYVHLVVGDERNRYGSYLTYDTGVSTQEIAFTPFTGIAYLDSNQQNVTITYITENGRPLFVEGDVHATYQIYDDSGKPVYDPIESNTLFEFELPEKLPSGNYKVSLLKSSVNDQIVNLSMDTELQRANEKGKHLEISFDKLSKKYGEIIPYELDLYTEDNGHGYVNSFRLQWNYATNKFNGHVGDSIQSEKMYTLVVKGKVSATNTLIYDETVVSGQELLDLNGNKPLQVSEDLKSLAVKYIGKPIDIKRTQLVIGKPSDEFGHQQVLPSIFNNDKEQFKVLISPNIYNGSFVIEDKESKISVISIPEFSTMNEDAIEIEVDNSSLAEIKVVNGTKIMPMFGYNFYPKSYLRLSNETDWINSVSYEMGHYEHLSFRVATNDQFDTPWGYNVSVIDLNLNEDKSYEFTGDITGVITEAQLHPRENGDTELFVDTELTSGDLRVEQIYRSLIGSRYGFSALSTSEDPIRDYKGIFNDMNFVPVEYVLKDETGKIVWDMTSHLGSYIFHIDKTFKPGIYTLEVHVPTALRKSIKLIEEISVHEGSVEFIKIDSPQNGSITNEGNVTITGTTNADTTVSLEMHYKDQVVENLNITADGEGKFTHTFKPTVEGKYTIVATHGDTAKASVTITIDRTAPEKASNIKFAKEAAGLKVTWTGAKDAVSYKVEVAENDETFMIISESQKETTATIPNIKPGATYKVKVTSADVAGNTSNSDVASFTVDTFTATLISLEDTRNTDKLLSIGEELTVKVDGSYEAGFTAVANVHVDGTAEEVILTYNETSKSYEGAFTVKEGHKVIEKVTGQIMNGNEKTEEISKELSWSVGSTVKGLVTDGTPVRDATIRLVSKKSYNAKTDAEGSFELKGLPEGNYNASVVVNGKTYVQQELVVGQSKIVAADFKVPALTDATFTIVDIGTTDFAKDGLSARLTGSKGYVVFGTTMDGKFTTNDGKTMLKDLETGEYKLTVYGQGAYQTTTASVTLEKGKTAYQVEVNKLTIDEKTLTIKVKGDIGKIDSLSLFSYSTYQKHGYTGIGSYYLYNVKPENGVIELKVAAADDYTLDIYTEGFMSVQQYVDMTSDSEIEITLEQGRIVTGKVVDGQGEPVANAYVYAYGGGTYSSAVTGADGMYKLIGLSKKDDLTLDVSSQIHLSYQETIDQGTVEVKKDIQLAKAAMMTGKVIDKDGQPLANVSISAEGENYSYGWSRTAVDGTFAVTGLKDTEKYNLSFYSYGYPTVIVEGKQPSDIGTVTLQATGTGDFEGEGNYLAASKASVVSGDEVQFTLAYNNNGVAEAKDIPVTLTIPAGLHLIEETVTLNGKAVKPEGNKVVIPAVAAGESGKITFAAKVGDVQAPSLTVNAKVTENGSILAATTSVVFVTLEAPALTGEKTIKVYGNAKVGSTVELFAGNQKVGETKVDGKWWFIDVELPVADTAATEGFTLSAKVKDGVQTTMSKPVTVTYQPDVPKMTDVTVHAGWNGNVKLNPYTGVATFAIVEHTPLDTTVKFDKEVDSASISFLGKSYELVKGADNTFTFDGQKLGKWTSYGEQLLEITFVKGDVEVTVPLMNIIVLIDPSGYVFEGSMDNKLEGVRAVVETKIGEDWVQWDAAKFGQINPQITDEEGRYGWDVIAGQWRVIFTKDGYEPYISRIMNVPPPETELNIPMVRNTDPAIVTSEVTEKDLTVEFDRLMNVANKSTFIQLFEVGSDTPIEGTVETTDKAGYKSISTPTDKTVGHIGKDSRDEDGFFAEDESKKLSTTFKFVPKTILKADTTYRLVVNGQIVDSAGMALGVEKEFTFTTAKAGTPAGGGGIITPPTPPVDPTPEKPEPLTPPVFTDITNTFAKNEINILAAKGIIQGKTETNFAPNAQITRAEFAVLLARALDLPMKDYEGKFGDVNASKKWAFAGVEAAARAGIVNGTTDGKFNPDAPIKREEIAAMIMRAIAYQDKTTLEGIDLPANFKDHGSIGAFAMDAVYKATAIGVIKGNNGNFNPKNNATRAEAAVMLYRALDSLKLVD